jgi:hypothetical protein
MTLLWFEFLKIEIKAGIEAALRSAPTGFTDRHTKLCVLP